MQLVDRWQQEIAQPTDEHTTLMEFQMDQWTKRQRGIQQRKILPMTFPPRLMQTLCESRALVYPSLLPLAPFFEEQQQVRKFTIGEE